MSQQPIVDLTGRWQIVDADWTELRRFRKVKGLPPRCVDAITGYMIGNRHLERGIRFPDTTELDEAIRCYTAAIARYPQNARLYFNRAVAYENLGNGKAAEADYAVALRDEAGRIRVQARQRDGSGSTHGLGSDWGEHKRPGDVSPAEGIHHRQRALTRTSGCQVSRDC